MTSKITNILTDIEGTTSSISFVKNTLFPYAAKTLPAFLVEHASEQPVKEQLDTLWSDYPETRNDMEASTQLLLKMISDDIKYTPLKSLQGMIWKKGYESGVYRAHIYEDAATELKRWHEQGLNLFVFSSGSIAAQKLFFRYSKVGDLSTLFSDHFDTTSGAKQDKSAYQNIARQLPGTAQSTLFLSDIREELDAAQEAGMQTCWLIRPEDSNTNLSEAQTSPHLAVSSFHTIKIAS